jgi:glycosyltransferase involved in cell wall biosynthesis
MRVGLITTWEERCGIAEYAKNLVNSVTALNDGVTFEVLDVRQSQAAIHAATISCDVVVFNYEPGLYQHLPIVEMVHLLRRTQKACILILHTSHAGDNRSVLTAPFTRVVVHEKTQDGFVHIPMGVPAPSPRVRDVVPNLVGTVGFPFPWKGFDIVAQATAKLDLMCLVIAPDSPHWDTYAVAKYLREQNPNLSVNTAWNSQEDVVEMLSQCAVNVFAYSGHPAGISGAVKLGVAAQRPLVISTCRQFRDMLEYYPEEVYVADPLSVDTVVEQIQLALYTRKFPVRMLQENAWPVVASMYRNVYLEALTEVRGCL